MQIPFHLLITPKVCAASEDLGFAFERNAEVFRRDEELMLTLFLMSERVKGVNSFWEPYVSILPREILLVQDWGEAQKEELQDVMLVGEAMRLRRQLDYVGGRQRIY